MLKTRNLQYMYMYTLLLQTVISIISIQHAHVIVKWSLFFTIIKFYLFVAQPEIMIEGQTQIKSGDTLHMYCKVSGYPLPVIEWYRDGEVIVKDDTRTNFLPHGDIPNGHLVLFNVHDTDRGIYECKSSSVQFEPVKSSTFIEVKGTICNVLLYLSLGSIISSLTPPLF